MTYYLAGALIVALAAGVGAWLGVRVAGLR